MHEPSDGLIPGRWIVLIVPELFLTVTGGGDVPAGGTSAQLDCGGWHLHTSFRINRLIWNDEINQ